MNTKMYLILLFLIVFVSEVRSFTEAGDIVPPKEYVQAMERFNEFFKFTRLDLVVRLFTWESGFDPLMEHKNTDGTTDLGISALNSKYLNDPDWNYVDMYWTPYFPNIKFNWKNPEHNMFMGMSVFKHCLKYAGNYYDALLCYNWGMGKYKDRYLTDPKHYDIPTSTKNIIEFVFCKEYWNDNLSYHWLTTSERTAKLKEIANAKRSKKTKK